MSIRVVLRPLAVTVVAAVIVSIGASEHSSTTSSAQVPTSQPPQVPTHVEKFEKVDPYTLGKAKELDRAGYVSFGPFPLADGIRTSDVEEILGSIPMLWVETAHFKLGSTLGTYRCTADDHRALHDALERLAKRLVRVKNDPVKLDPWLRLHLYAQQLEEQYADFEARFGLADEDFAPKANRDSSAAGYMGPGPFLGQELKFTVLLTEPRSQVARFAKRWLSSDDRAYYRGLLPGGSRFFGTSAESARKYAATDLDSALSALVACELTHSFVDGFRGGGSTRPLWFAHGLALGYGRRVDPRWSLYVPRTETNDEENAGRWEPKLAGLVTNDFVPKWDEMLAWQALDKLERRDHMCVWSRVDWLLTLDKAALRAYLMASCPPPDLGASEAETLDAQKDRQSKALTAAFGKSPSQLDEAWRKWVAKKYPKR